ncbi:LapA family protein [Novosphingobium sp. RD2P27]|uniref:LapA family protein n=1 Tax=Novosphingobium kalidii TaxID=3230299 RepID=A0ABV2CYD0_9SPHN
MQIIRTIVWIILTAILVAFIAMNWTKVPVNFWPLDGGNYVHFEWPVGIVALVFFLLGAVPMWLVHRTGKWRLKRRIHSLENTMLATSSAPVPSTLEETTTSIPEPAANRSAAGPEA